MSWVFFAILSSIATTLLVAFGSAATKYIDSATMNAIRAMVILTVTFGVSYYNGQMSLTQLGEAGKTKGLYLAVMAGVFGSIAWITYFVAVGLGRTTQSGTAAQVAAINSSYIVLLAIVEPLFRIGAPVTISQSAGIMLVFAGIILVLVSR